MNGEGASRPLGRAGTPGLHQQKFTHAIHHTRQAFSRTMAWRFTFTHVYFGLPSQEYCQPTERFW
jgi:hypothetical protein